MHRSELGFRKLPGSVFLAKVHFLDNIKAKLEKLSKDAPKRQFGCGELGSRARKASLTAAKRHAGHAMAHWPRNGTLAAQWRTGRAAVYGPCGGNACDKSALPEKCAFPDQVNESVAEGGGVIP